VPSLVNKIIFIKNDESQAQVKSPPRQVVSISVYMIFGGLLIKTKDVCAIKKI
jgi:hypothetical protein